MEVPSRPDEMVGRRIPDVELPSSADHSFSLTSRIGRGPLVLFFFIHNGTPG